jgi:glyoxylase-like metal-dependent hydrolase (beta-lactamase superfamily II)
MKKFIFATVLLIATGYAQTADEETPLNEEPHFEQVSDHCYLLHIEENGENIAVVATEQGSLLFDPPPDPDLSILIECLKDLNGGPVRWMINTGNYFLQTSGVEYFSARGAVLLAGFRQYAQKANGMIHDLEQVAEPGSDDYENRDTSTDFLSGWADSRPAYPDLIQREPLVSPRFVFKRRMWLYPEDLEIQIQALPHEARTEADVFAYVPGEKVLFTGRLFEPSYYPDIDVLAGGSALKWIDALQRVIDSVPLLISAIPPEEPEEDEENGKQITEEEKSAELEARKIEGDEVTEEEEEMTLEEMITVIPARGEVTNLLMMKDLLDTARKLQRGISRAVKSGRSCEEYLDSPESYPYQTYGNYYPYATQLCKELSPEEETAPTDF